MTDKLELGAQLRAARQKLGLSLRALGDLTNLSASFLSQVELAQAIPSLGSLQRIASALGLTVSALLARETSQGAVVRKAGRSSLRSEWSKATLESLVSGSADERFQAMLVRLDPTGRTGVAHYGAGRRLFAYCTDGAAVALVTDPSEELLVGTGDSLVVDGPRTVAWLNHVAQVTELVVIDALLR